MSEQVVEQRNEVAQAGVVDTTLVPVKPSDVVPLNYEAALASYSPEEQKEIMDLSASIDVRRIDNVMHYGGTVLKTTFDQCGALLKEERGSAADQEVIAQVIKLSKKASDSYDDFNLVLKEPNLFQKLILAITTGGKASQAQTEKIQNSAVTNYQLLLELKSSCEAWLEMLRRAMGQINESAMSDVETGTLLEKYIIAGKMAEERIGQELATIQSQYQKTGLQKYSMEYEEMKEGYNAFVQRMSNLEKSRVMYCLSFGQLSLIKRSNRNVQTSIHTQMDNSLTLMSQQLRNAVLNAKNREVLEGQKAISRLNDELIRDVSKSVGLTAEETEKLLYAGFYDVEAAKAAVTAVISSCQEIQKTAEAMLPKMKADTAELNALIEQLEPYVDSVKTRDDSASTNRGATTTNNGNLSF